MLEFLTVFSAAILGTGCGRWLYDWATDVEEKRKAAPQTIMRYQQSRPKREIFGRRDKAIPKVHDDQAAWNKENNIPL